MKLIGFDWGGVRISPHSEASPIFKIPSSRLLLFPSNIFFG